MRKNSGLDGSNRRPIAARTRLSRIIRQGTAAALMLCLAIPARVASAHGVPDQTPTSGTSLFASATGPLFHFTPTASNIVGVDMSVWISRTGVSVQALLFESVDCSATPGPLIATTNTVITDLNFNNGPSTEHHFDFPSVVPLTPGKQYKLWFKTNYTSSQFHILRDTVSPTGPYAGAGCGGVYPTEIPYFVTYAEEPPTTTLDTTTTTLEPTTTTLEPTTTTLEPTTTTLEPTTTTLEPTTTTLEPTTTTLEPTTTTLEATTTTVEPTTTTLEETTTTLDPPTTTLEPTTTTLIPATTTTTTIETACGGAPATGCLGSEKAQLLVGNSASDEKDKITWKMKSGDAFDHASLGDPASTRVYTLCIWDRDGSTANLKAQVEIPSGADWTDRDLKGFSYQYAGKSMKVALKPGAEGKASVSFSAKGASVEMPAPVSAEAYFSASPDVTVQLVNNETSTCWTTSFAAAKTNTGTSFKAKAP